MEYEFNGLPEIVELRYKLINRFTITTEREEVEIDITEPHRKLTWLAIVLEEYERRFKFLTEEIERLKDINA